MASGASSRKIDESWVESKLRMANDSMESVQTLSLWALNHKTEHEQIVDIWLKVFKSADENQMVVLIYLCNDILQTCKRRNALMFKDSFKKALKDAVHLIKGDKPVASFKKILKVWSERNVFEGKYVEELSSIAFGKTTARSSISDDKPVVTQINKLSDDKSTNDNKTRTTRTMSSSSSLSSLNSEEIDPDVFNDIENSITNYTNLSKSDSKNINQSVNITKQTKTLPNLSLSDFNFSKLSKMVNQELKHSNKLTGSMTSCNIYLSNIDKITSSTDAEKQKSYLMNKCDEINSICHAYGLLTEQITEKEQLIVHLELAKLYYKERNKDTKLVASAYKNYASRVQNLSKKLLERRQLLMLSEQSKDDDEEDEDDDGHNNYDDDDSGHDGNKGRGKSSIYDANISDNVNNSTSGIPDKDKNSPNTLNNSSSGGGNGSANTKHLAYHDNVSFYGDGRGNYDENMSHHLVIKDDNGNDDAENDDDDMLFNQLFTGEMNDNNHDDDLKFATNDKRDDKIKTRSNIRRRASLDERLKLIELGGFSSNFEDDMEPPPAKTSKLSIPEDDSGQNVDVSYQSNMSKDVEYDGRATPVLDEHSPMSSSSSLVPTSSSTMTLVTSSSSSSLKSDSKSHQSRLEELFINFKKASGKILKMRTKSSADDYEDNNHSRNKNKQHKHKETKDYKHRDEEDHHDDRHNRESSHRHHKSTEKKESESKHGYRITEHKQDQRSKEDDSRHKSRKDDGKYRDDSSKYDDQPPPPPPPPARVSDVATSITNSSLLINSDGGHTLAASTSSVQYTYDYYTQQMSGGIIPATSVINTQTLYQTINTSDGIAQLQTMPSTMGTSQYMYEEILYVFAEEEDAVGQLQQLGQLPIQQQQQQLFQGQLASITSNPGNMMIANTTTTTSSSSSDNLYGDKYAYPAMKNDNNIMLMTGQVQQQQHQQQPHQTLSMPMTVTQNLQQQLPQQQQHQLLLQPQQPTQQQQQQAHIQQYIPLNMPPPIIQPQPLIIQQQQQQQQQYSLQIPPPPLPQPSIPPQTHLPPPPPFAFTQHPPPPLPQSLVSAPHYPPPPQLKRDISPSPYSYAPSTISVISSASSSSSYHPMSDSAAVAVIKGGPRLARDQILKPTNVAGFVRRPSALTTITLAEDDDIADDGDFYNGNDVVYTKGVGGAAYRKAINPSMFSSCVYSSKSVYKSQSYIDIDKMKTVTSIAQSSIGSNNNNISNDTNTEVTTVKQQPQQPHSFNPSSNLVLLSSNKNIGITTSSSTYSTSTTSYVVTTAATTTVTTSNTTTVTSNNATSIVTSIGTSSITTPTATNVIASNSCTLASNTILLSTNTSMAATITCVTSENNSSAKVQPLPDSSTTTIQTIPNATNTEQKNTIPAQEPDSSGLADTNYNSSDSSDLEDFPDAVTFTAPLSVVKSNSSLTARQSYLQKQFASIKNSNPNTTVGTPLMPPRVPLNLFTPRNMSVIANRAVDILMRGGPRAPLLRAPPQPIFRGPVHRLPPPPPTHQPIFPSFSMSRRPRF